MLEQDREKLVNATREMYNRLEAHETWPGPPLERTPQGFPLVHDILDRLGLLNLVPGDYEEIFEESTEELRKQMRCTQLSTEEAIPYPTPATIQSGFSPPKSDVMESFPSQFLGSDGTLAVDPYQHTLPAGTPNEQIPCMHDSRSMGVTSQLGDAASYPWYQSPSYAVMDNHSYSVPPYGLGLTHERFSPCLPTYNDDFGYSTFGKVST